MRRRLSLLTLGALLIGGLAAGVMVSSGGAGTAAVAPKKKITVRASEFKFVLSTKTARHGVVTFKVTNKGHTAHDFKIAGKKTAKLGPGKSATLKVTLTKGPHKYICTIDSHAALGMKGTFKST